MQNPTEAEAVSNEVSVIPGFDVGSLDVDTVQPMNNDVVDNDHLICDLRVSIFCVWVLRTKKRAG